VHVLPSEDVRKKYDEYNGKDMQRVMEIYNHGMDHEAQLGEHRARHFDVEVIPPKPLTATERAEINATMATWEFILQLIKSGTPTDGIKTIAEKTVKGLKAKL
jgi:hypothetical protein